MDDKEPLIQVDREEFTYLSAPPRLEISEGGRRPRKEKARLVTLKPWLRPGRRKWSFEWNGVPISAPISDPAFWPKIESREYLIGAGDALDVILEYQQDYDEKLKVYVNDVSTFEVTTVEDYVSKNDEQTSLLK